MGTARGTHLGHGRSVRVGTGHPPKRPKIRGKAEAPHPHGSKKIGFPHGLANAIWGYYPKPQPIWYSSVLYL